MYIKRININGFPNPTNKIEKHYFFKNKTQEEIELLETVGKIITKFIKLYHIKNKKHE